MALPEAGTRRAVFALLVLGLLQCAAYCWALRTGGETGLGCYDQNCYAQAARRIVEGHAFSYAPGQPPTTGQTSVIYPFVLAVPMALGAEGSAIRTASLALSCLFYLVFLAGWGVVIGRFFPRGFGRAAAIALVGLSGVCAYVAFAQCDQGLWMAVSALIAAALACGSERWIIALLTLAPWVRPEGMMLVAAFAAVNWLSDFRRFRLSSLLPLLSVLAVFALNFALTGQAQFSSVANKGYFKAFPFWTATGLAIKDGLSIVAAYLCSVPVPISRLFTLPSPVGSLAFWAGLFVLVRRPRDWNPAVVTFFLAGSMCLASTSLGGFAGLDFDRYLAWTMPVVFLTAAFGLGWVCDRIRHPLWQKLPIVALIMTTLFSTGAMALMMREVSPKRLIYINELREEVKHLPPDASVGSEEFIWAYELPPTARYDETSGIFSPAFNSGTCDQASGPEILRHEPEKRFDYWVGCPLAKDQDTPENRRKALSRYGAPLCPGHGRKYLRRADWSAYDRANETILSPLVPVARLDVGYQPDERAAGLRMLSAAAMEHVRFPMVIGRPDGQLIVDSYAIMMEGHEFSLPVTPNRVARLVLRTIGKVTYAAQKGKEESKEFGTAKSVRISIGGRNLGTFEIPLRQDVCTDYVIDIPADFLVSSRAGFRIEGRLPVFGYWLYQ